jgi:glycosyltransferase involved in cell wall biosynthesis
VLFLPARDEAPRVAAVVERVPCSVLGRPVVVVVVDDGSTDDTAQVARAAGARVVDGGGLGLGAAVRLGLAEALLLGAAVIAFCDADGEYDPAELPVLAGSILDGDADYVVGSRFAGRIRRMHPHRRAGNQVLTRWVRWLTRLPVTDGQSGFRALSPAAAASAVLVHDYNYAQILTLDLVGKGFRYAEVPITYAFRRSGKSFVRLGRYLRQVIPAVWRELQAHEPTLARETSTTSATMQLAGTNPTAG